MISRNYNTPSLIWTNIVGQTAPLIEDQGGGSGSLDATIFRIADQNEAWLRVRFGRRFCFEWRRPHPFVSLL